MKTSLLLKATIPIVLLSACNQVEEDVAKDFCDALSVRVFTSEMINGDADTRVAIDLSSGSPVFPFVENDTLGIFPSVGDQVSFPLAGSAGSTSASFDGGGWGLKQGISYYAYLPFSRANFASYDQKNSLSVSFLGQMQDNVNNTDGIGKYVYMTTIGTTQTSGVLLFKLHHVGALARIGITFPEAATFTRIYIQAESDVFATAGTLDLESNEVTISPVTRSDRITLSLKNVKITSQQLSTAYNFYMMFPPCDCTGQTLKIVLVDSFGNTYTANTRVGKANNFLAGHYYGFTTTESFVKAAGAVDDDGGNLGFLIESDEMTGENVNLNF